MNWSSLPEDETVEPFTVVLAIGPPRPLTGSADSDADATAGTDDEDLQHWAWQDTISALLHVVFARGGSVVARFDEDTFPLLWSTALSYCEPRPAEHGDQPQGVPLEILAMDRWYESIAGDALDKFEATGAVRIWRQRPEPELNLPWPPGPGRRFGVLLLKAGQASEDEIFDDVEQILTVDWAGGAVDSQPSGDATIQLQLDSAFDPVDALLEFQLDDWLGLQ